jgi:hypothetical protein
LAVLLLASLAGCAGRTATTAPPADPCKLATPDPACAKPAPPQPIDVRDSVDMLEAGSRDYTWKVGPGLRSLSVAARFDGIQKAPAFEVLQMNYRLTGGPDGTVYARGNGNTSHGGVASPGTCLICFDDTQAEEGLAALAGDWALHIDWGRSEAHYDLQVTATYGP